MGSVVGMDTRGLIQRVGFTPKHPSCNFETCLAHGARVRILWFLAVERNGKHTIAATVAMGRARAANGKHPIFVEQYSFDPIEAAFVAPIWRRIARCGNVARSEKNGLCFFVVENNYFQGRDSHTAIISSPMILPPRVA